MSLTIHRRLHIAVFLGGLAGIAWPVLAQQSTVRIGGDAVEIRTLDPHRTAIVQEKGLISLIFGGLVRFQPGSTDPSKIEGDLAESWQSSADELSWTFKLRRGVQFHRNFGEATSEDVVYSLTRAADPKRSSFSTNFEVVKEIRALNAYTVQIILKSPAPGFLGLVANYHGGMIVSRRAVEELKDSFSQTPVGFGPYEFSEYQPKRELVLKANETYYRGKPRIARITYRLLPSDTIRELAFATGDLDLIVGQRDQKWVDRAKLWTPPKDQASVKVDVFAPGEFRTLMLNRTIKPLDDLRVRAAVAHAIDVKELIRQVGASVVKPGRSVVPPGYEGEVDVGDKFPHDLAKARTLLAQAGYPKGVDLKVVVSRTAAQLPVMETVRKQLERAGINLVFDLVDHPVFHAKIRKNESAIIFYGAARFPVADTYLTEFYHSRSAIGTPTQVTNFSHCSVADREIDAARAARSSIERLSLWRIAQEKISTDVCAIPLFDLRQVWVRRATLDYGVPFDGSLNLIPPLHEKSTIGK